MRRFRKKQLFLFLLLSLTIPISVAALIFYTSLDPSSDAANNSNTSTSYTRAHVKLTSERKVQLMYKVLLNRDIDPVGLDIAMYEITKNGMSERTYFEALMQSPEFRDNPNNNNIDKYVRRVYSHILEREIDSFGINNVIPGVQSGSLSWYKVFNDYINSDEFRGKQLSRYATQNNLYKQQYNTNALTQSRIQSLNLANIPVQYVQFDRSSYIGEAADGNFYGGDGRAQVIRSSTSNEYLVFTRGIQIRPDGQHTILNIYLLKSSNGTRYDSGVPIYKRAIEDGGVYYDPYVVIDTRVLPNRYIIFTECVVPGMEAGGICSSYTSTPELPQSWSYPKVLVEGCDNNPNSGCSSNEFVSGATPIAFVENNKVYLGFSELNDGITYDIDNGDEFVRFRMAQIPLAFNKIYSHVPFSRLGYANSFGSVKMDVTQNINCNDKWDCNNRHAQDIKKFDGKYYLFYNGGNYFRCVRNGSTGSSRWGIGVWSSNTVNGQYSAVSTPQGNGLLLLSQLDNTCGLQYPIITFLGSSIFLDLVEIYVVNPMAPDVHHTRTARYKLTQ